MGEASLSRYDYEILLVYDPSGIISRNLLESFHNIMCEVNESITASSAWELTSVYMRYSQGDGVHTPLSQSCTVTTFGILWSVILCTLVLPSARSCAVCDENNKDNVCTRSIPAGLKCPPPSTTISSIPWFEAYLNSLSERIPEGLHLRSSSLGP